MDEAMSNRDKLDIIRQLYEQGVLSDDLKELGQVMDAREAARIMAEAAAAIRRMAEWAAQEEE